MEQPIACRGDGSGEQKKPNETASAEMAEIEELKTHDGKSRFGCPICGRIFEDDESAAIHSNDSDCSKSLLKKKLNPSMVPVVKDVSTEKEENSTGLRATDQNESRKDGCEGSAIQQPNRTGNDERLLLAKYEKIFPSVNELTVLESYVKTVEQSLFAVSKELGNQDEPNHSLGNTPGTRAAPQPMLDSIHRVGLFGESLQLRGDRDVQLVMLYSQNSPPPTLELVDQVAQKLRAHLKVHEPWMKFTLESYSKKALVLLKACALVPNSIPGRDLDGEIVIQIWLSSTAFGSENVATNPSAGGIGDKGVLETKESVLNIKDCLRALNLVHRLRWFRGKKHHLKRKAVYFMVLLRIMSNFCRGTPVWSKIDFWMIESIVAQAADTTSTPSLPFLLLKTFTSIANGFFLKSGDDELSPAAAYPWKDYDIDVSANLSVDDRKIITSSAQNCFRLIAKGQLNKVLGFVFPDPFQSGESCKDTDSEDVAALPVFLPCDRYATLGLHPREVQIVRLKHFCISPMATELSAVKNYMDIVEQSLTKVSDELRNQDKLKIDSSAGVQEGSSIGTTPAAPQPMLRSFHRVGYFGEDLQLQGDRDVQLVLLCSPPPTLELVDRVAQTLSAHLKESLIKFTVESYPEQSLVLVKGTPNFNLEGDVVIKITLTSFTLRLKNIATTPSAGVPEMKECTPNIKDCFHALDLYYRQKWIRYEKFCLGTIKKAENFMVVLRIMQDFCRRTPVWSKIDFWLIEFIVAQTIYKAPFITLPMPLPDLLCRTFTTIAEGFFLKSGDEWSFDDDKPWDEYLIDIFADLSVDDREKITSSAIECLGLILNGGLYKVLGFPRRPPEIFDDSIP